MDIAEIIRKQASEDGTIPAEAVETIVTALKTAIGNEFVEKERYKKKLTEIDALKEQQQNAEDSATSAEKWKVKYDNLKESFDTYKAEVKSQATTKAKTDVFRNLLKESGVDPKRVDTIVKVSGDEIASIELDDNGNGTNLEGLTKSIADNWADFIVVEGKQGTKTPTPPENPATTFTKEDIAKMSVEEINKNWEAIKPTLAK